MFCLLAFSSISLPLYIILFRGLAPGPPGQPRGESLNPLAEIYSALLSLNPPPGLFELHLEMAFICQERGILFVTIRKM